MEPVLDSNEHNYYARQHGRIFHFCFLRERRGTSNGVANPSLGISS
jgi:hypothetical protein